MDRNVDEPKLQIFSDAEINVFLALVGSDVFEAAAMACRSIGAEAGRCKIAYTLLSGELRIDRTKISDFFLDLADRFDKKALQQPGFHLQEVGSLIHPAHGIDETQYDEANVDQDLFFKQDYRTEGDV